MNKIKSIYSTTDPAIRGIVFAGMTAFLWGFLPIALKVAVKEVDPVTVTWMRFAVAFAVLSTFFALRSPGSLGILTRPPLLLLIASLGLAANYVTYIMGLELTTPSNAQVVIQLAPIILALVGLFIFRERISRVQGLGLLLAVTGFSFFYRDQLTGLVGARSDYNLGTSLVVFSAMAWVLYAAIQKKLVRIHPPQQLNLVLYGFPVLVIAPFVDFQGLFQLSTSYWLLMLFLGLNTLAAYGFLAEAFKYTEANKVGIIITINPIITIIAMYTLEAFQVSWVKPEHISWYGLVGAALIIGGAILAVRKSPTLKKEVASELNYLPKQKTI